MHDARTMALPMVCWVWPMHQTMVDGRFLAKVSVTRLSCSGETPVTFSTSSGVHCLTSSRIFSMP